MIPAPDGGKDVKVIAHLVSWQSSFWSWCRGLRPDGVGIATAAGNKRLLVGAAHQGCASRHAGRQLMRQAWRPELRGLPLTCFRLGLPCCRAGGGGAGGALRRSPLLVAHLRPAAGALAACEQHRCAPSARLAWTGLLGCSTLTRETPGQLDYYEWMPTHPAQFNTKPTPPLYASLPARRRLAFNFLVSLPRFPPPLSERVRYA